MKSIGIVVFTIFLCREICAIIKSDAVNPLAVPGGQLIDKIFLPNDVKGNFTELARKCGYMADKHTVITRDGYLLGLFRIKGKNHCYGRKRTPPVVMMHGWLDSADTWLLAGCDVALGYALANSCYDVWCASHRGDFYGRAHRTLDPDQDVEFWNYAFEELGGEDLPAIIDYVTEQTGSPDVFYIGHSQGTTDLLVMTSSKPEYNAKIRLAILLAPIAWLDNVLVKTLHLVADNYPLIHKAFNITGIREMFGRNQPTHKISAILCSIVPELCNIPYFLIGGDRPGSISRRTLQFAGGHFLSGSSVKNFIQFTQILRDGRFARYDYGRSQNLQLYGTDPPPEFDLSNVRAPAVLIAGLSDKLSVIADVDRLYASLPNVLEYYIVPDPGFGHFDFTWGKNSPRYITPKVLDYFNRYSDGINDPNYLIAV